MSGVIMILHQFPASEYGAVTDSLDDILWHLIELGRDEYAVVYPFFCFLIYRQG